MVKVFLSYRRDDTGGRAGRLADALADRYGRRNVFQDVTGVAPGVDFMRHVDEAIAASDAMLVVIGPRWVSTTDDEGRRRIDNEDDFVRREVGAALASDLPVVPVLVDGAALPAAADLPDELLPIVQRQAVELSDVSWHADVEDLARRLEGEAGGETATRRWVWMAATGAVVLLVVVGVVVAIGGGGTGGDSWEELPPCEPLGEGAEELVPASGSPIEATDGESTVQFVADGGEVIVDGSGEATYVVGVWMRNVTEPGVDADVPYFSEGSIDNMLVDGVSTGDPICIGIVEGRPNVEPGERARAEIGFRSTAAATGAPVLIEIGDDDLAIGTVP